MISPLSPHTSPLTGSDARPGLERRARRSFPAIIAIALLLAAASATAQGPQTPDCGTYTLSKDTKVAGHLFAKGVYRINAFGISCEKVLGKYGLFDQFLNQDENAPLPKPWKYLSEAVGAPKFTAAPGVGFRAQWLSN